MNIGELLQIPAYTGCRVAAGREGLGRVVQSVNIMDAPDIIEFVKPSELLLTNAYFLRDDPQAMLALICAMDEIGCAGLAVKTNRFIHAIPDIVMAEADRLSFPIIELTARQQSLGDTVHQSLTVILEQKTEELRFALDIHGQFTSLVLRGQGLPEMTQSLSELLGQPVLLLDTKLSPVAESVHFSSEPLRGMKQHLTDLLPLHYPSPSPFTLGLLVPPMLRGSSLLVYPIHSIQLHGVLLAFSLDADEQSLPLLAVEQAVNVIRFEMLKRQAVRERSRRYKNEYFSNLTEGVFTSEHELLHQGRRYGLTGSEEIVCVTVREDPAPAGAGPAGELAASSASNGTAAASLRHRSEEYRLSERELLYDLMKPALEKHGLPCIRFVKNHSVILLLLDPPISGHSLSETLLSIGEEVYRLHGLSISFGIGKQVEQLLDIPLTCREAAEALEFGYQAGKRRFAQPYHGRELTDLFRLISPAELHTFVSDTFLPLEVLEPKERAELLRTLQAYYDQQCSIAAASKQLFLHRNTVIYRLDKCRQLFGQELHAPAISLRIRLALLMTGMPGVSG
ncbi:PucR family transcriptional regulator [Paenibacillus sp. GCM10023252]|uniref:PucR family transcriptional regulator n=1 Tax=Paenibacillus sp. GCM10023252 TaxID=3252649 RepID=UPI003617CD06